MSLSPPAWMLSIRGVLMDITGVLYDSGVGDGKVIDGSIDAVNRLAASDKKYRFVSNETSHTRQGLAERLNRLGFTLSAEQIFTPAPACKRYLLDNGLRPHLLVHKEFDGVDMHEPNCVVMGDAAEYFTWHAMNVAMNVLLKLNDKKLITLGAGKYYKETDGLKMDVGAYAAALKFACDIETTTVIGKPSAEYYKAALKCMGLPAEEVLMVGDDIVSDIGGAQAIGMRAIQVRTGKWQPSWENHATVRPDAIVDDLRQAVELLLKT